MTSIDEVEQAAERLRKRQDRDSHVRPLRPDRDLTWNRMPEEHDDFEPDYDHDSFE